MWCYLLTDNVLIFKDDCLGNNMKKVMDKHSIIKFL